jgi:hypothetical protein
MAIILKNQMVRLKFSDIQNNSDHLALAVKAVLARKKAHEPCCQLGPVPRQNHRPCNGSTPGPWAWEPLMPYSRISLAKGKPPEYLRATAKRR